MDADLSEEERREVDRVAEEVAWVMGTTTEAAREAIVHCLHAERRVLSLSSSFMCSPEVIPVARRRRRKPKLGSGKRFKSVAASARRSGARNPNAVAAVAGRKKWGKKRMARMAARGRRRAARRRRRGRRRRR